MTIAEIVSAYLRHAGTVNLFGAETFSERRRVLSKFASLYGGITASEARAFHLSDWIENNPRWRSTATRKAKANQVNAAFNWAVRQGRIDRNPFASVRYDESEPRPPMPDSDYALLIELGNKPFDRAVQFLRFTSIRLSELCGMNWEDIDFERNVLIIRRHKSRKKTKKNKIVPLTKESVCLLQQLQCLTKVCEASSPVFVNNRGTRWTRGTLGQQLRRIKARHGLKMSATLHGLRHQVATAAIARGESPKLVAHLLGHSSMQTTERFYCHLENEIEAVRAVAEKAMPTVIQNESYPKRVDSNIVQTGFIISSALTR